MKPTYHIEIIDNERTTNLGGQCADDEWSRDSTATDHHIRGFVVVPEDDYGDFLVDYEPAFGIGYYLLYAVYSTGDSFGHDEGRGIEYIGLYTENQRSVADENIRRIDIHNRAKSTERTDLMLLTPDGQTEYQMSVPWHGYFESLDYVDCVGILRIDRRRLINI